MGELTCLKQGPGVTPHCIVRTAGETGQQSSLRGRVDGEGPVEGVLGEVTSYRGTDVRPAH